MPACCAVLHRPPVCLGSDPPAQTPDTVEGGAYTVGGVCAANQTTIAVYICNPGLFAQVRTYDGICWLAGLLPSLCKGRITCASEMARNKAIISFALESILPGKGLFAPPVCLSPQSGSLRCAGLLPCMHAYWKRGEGEGRCALLLVVSRRCACVRALLAHPSTMTLVFRLWLGRQTGISSCTRMSLDERN